MDLRHRRACKSLKSPVITGRLTGDGSTANRSNKRAASLYAAISVYHFGLFCGSKSDDSERFENLQAQLVSYCDVISPFIISKHSAITSRAVAGDVLTIR